MLDHDWPKCRMNNCETTSQSVQNNSKVIERCHARFDCFVTECWTVQSAWEKPAWFTTATCGFPGFLTDCSIDHSTLSAIAQRTDWCSSFVVRLNVLQSWFWQSNSFELSNIHCFKSCLLWCCCVITIVRCELSSVLHRFWFCCLNSFHESALCASSKWDNIHSAHVATVQIHVKFLFRFDPVQEIAAWLFCPLTLHVWWGLSKWPEVKPALGRPNQCSDVTLLFDHLLFSRCTGLKLDEIIVLLVSEPFWFSLLHSSFDGIAEINQTDVNNQLCCFSKRCAPRRKGLLRDCSLWIMMFVGCIGNPHTDCIHECNVPHTNGYPQCQPINVIMFASLQQFWRKKEHLRWVHDSPCAQTEHTQDPKWHKHHGRQCTVRHSCCENTWQLMIWCGLDPCSFHWEHQFKHVKPCLECRYHANDTTFFFWWADLAVG